MYSGETSWGKKQRPRSRPLALLAIALHCDKWMKQNTDLHEENWIKHCQCKGSGAEWQ